MQNRDYKTDLQCVYNNIASHFSKTRHFIWPEMYAFLPYIQSGAHIIDIGCGNGRLISMLKDKDCTYVGIDQSDGLLAEARRLWPGYSFEQGDMEVYHYGRDRFDAAFFIASIHHLTTNAAQTRTLQRVSQALKPNGYIFITTWNMWQPKYRQYIQKEPFHHSYIPYNNSRDVSHRFYYAFTKTELTKVCKDAGLKIIDIWYSNKDLRVTKADGRNICLIAQKATA